MRHFLFKNFNEITDLLYDSDEFDVTVDTDRVEDDTVGSRPPSRDREEGNKVKTAMGMGKMI